MGNGRTKVNRRCKTAGSLHGTRGGSAEEEGGGGGAVEPLDTTSAAERRREQRDERSRSAVGEVMPDWLTCGKPERLVQEQHHGLAAGCPRVREASPTARALPAVPSRAVSLLIPTKTHSYKNEWRAARREEPVLSPGRREAAIRIDGHREVLPRGLSEELDYAWLPGSTSSEAASIRASRALGVRGRDRSRGRRSHVAVVADEVGADVVVDVVGQERHVVGRAPPRWEIVGVGQLNDPHGGCFDLRLRRLCGYFPRAG